MRLISTTLTGNNEKEIGDAIASVVDWVDVCLVIDTGVTDGSLDVARRIAGSKYLEKKFSWVNDFAAARNFSITAAEGEGADWSVTVDTDERLLPNGEPIRQVLERTKAGSLLVTHESSHYDKTRFFRHPCPVRWEGPTHESFAGYKVGAETLPKMRFAELPKSPEAYAKKFARDEVILTKHIAEHPNDPRWHYYLGDTLKNLGRNAEAIVAYKKCAALRGWNEESAWACYRAAECACVLERFDDAIDLCAEGLARHSGIAELAWLASFANFKLNRLDQAIGWARMSVALGHFEGCGRSFKRIGFKNPQALYEGPFDVMRFAYKAMGDEIGARIAEQKYESAKAARSGGERKTPTSAARAH